MKLVVLFHNAAAMATGHSFIHSLPTHPHTVGCDWEDK